MAKIMCRYFKLNGYYLVTNNSYAVVYLTTSLSYKEGMALYSGQGGAFYRTLWCLNYGIFNNLQSCG